MEIVVLLYDGVSAAEALGPVEVLRRLPATTVRFVAEDPGPQRAQSPPLDLEATHALEQVDSADVMVVPGGFGSQTLIPHRPLLEWIQRVHTSTQWTIAVSTGSVLLAAAGLLTGRQATTHWLANDLLVRFGAVPISKRVVRSGTVITVVGAAAAIDTSLAVAARSGGQQMADEIWAELATDLDEAFDPEKSYAAAATVRRWHERGQAPQPISKHKGLWKRLRRRAPRRVVREMNRPIGLGRDEEFLELNDLISEEHNSHD